MPRAITPTRIIIFPLLSVVAIGALIFSLGANNQTARAISGWDAGYIMSDYVFTNKSSMNTGDIQAFLNSKVPNCDTYGEQPSEFGGGTRRQWAEARGYSPPYTCLKDYSQNGKSAAQIIYEAAQAYSINPQVLLVLLQKEQGLVRDQWPLSIQYRSATGYGCPDTAACDSEYYGFTNQVRWAATMFRAIMNDSPTWYTPYEVGNNYIQYNPDSACGGSTVNIRNRATQALYNYTPYQPNQGALDAGWGTAHCGAYGNRNFYLYFTSWFGDTRTSRMFVALKDPRWMQLKNDARKVDPLTGQEVDGALSAGRHIRFNTKTTYTINGQECLRSEHDTRYNYRRCILRSDIQEIPMVFEPITETLVRATANTFKRDLRRGTIIQGTSIPDTRQVVVSAKITIGGKDYFISKHDYEAGHNFGLFAWRFTTSTATYEDITPQWFELSQSTTKVTPVGSTAIGGTLPQGMQRQYTSRAFVNGEWHYRTAHDTLLQYDRAIPESKLNSLEYTAFNRPRWMVLGEDTQKVAPLSGVTASETLSKGRQIKFSSKMRVGNTWYYRTEHDTNGNINMAIPASDIKEILFEPFVHPRTLSLNKDAAKYTPAEGTTIGSTYPTGLTRSFNSKVEINGIWYYRTSTDTQYNANSAFRADDLEEAN